MTRKYPNCNAAIEVTGDAAVRICPACYVDIEKSDRLSIGWMIFTWLATALCPLSILLMGLLYYSWRKTWPHRASQLARHSGVAFGMGVLLWIYLLLPAGFPFAPQTESGIQHNDFFEEIIPN